MAATRARHWLCAALSTARQLRRESLRAVAQGTGIPVARVIAFEEGKVVPDPAEFWTVWNFLANDGLPMEYPLLPAERAPR